MKGFKILIVDDDEALSVIIQQLLNREGYETRCAHSTPEAYRQFLKFRPGLVISDLHMPEEDGIELMRRIRRIADVRTIYMSGDLGRFDDKLKAEREKYPIAFIEKPFVRGDLLCLVTEMEKSLDSHVD